MNDNEENAKIKLTLDKLFPKTENKTNPSDAPLQSEEQHVPPIPKPAPEPSLTENQEGLNLKLKTSGTKLPETEEKNIPVQEVKLKLKPIKNVSDATDKEDVLPEPPKSNEQIPSSLNISTEQGGKDPLLNFVDTQKEKTQKIVLKKATAPQPVINLNDTNIKSEESPVNRGEEKNKTSFNDFEVLSSNGNEKKSISDTVKLQLKPKTASSSAFSTLTSEEKPEVPAPVEKNNDKAYDTIGGVAGNTAKSAKKNIKYLYIAGALVIIIVLLYFLISTIKTLMTI